MFRNDCTFQCMLDGDKKLQNFNEFEDRERWMFKISVYNLYIFLCSTSLARFKVNIFYISSVNECWTKRSKKLQDFLWIWRSRTLSVWDHSDFYTYFYIILYLLSVSNSVNERWTKNHVCWILKDAVIFSVIRVFFCHCNFFRINSLSACQNY